MRMSYHVPYVPGTWLLRSIPLENQATHIITSNETNIVSELTIYEK
jgi:hypothetical protein